MWENVEFLSLTENMRVKNEKKKHPNDVTFHQQLNKHEKWLLNLGENKLPTVESVKSDNIIEIPDNMCRDTKDDVVQAVFGDFRENIGNKNYFKSRILLAATNEVVDEINDEMVEQMPGDAHTLTSVDTVGDTDNPTMFPPEFLNKLDPSGLPQHRLKLKKNTVVILLRNMNLPAGHCNGTRYLVKHIGTYRLLLEKLNTKLGDTNTTLLLPRIPMVHKNKHIPCTVSQLQFPIKIAYCLTIDRAQGQSASKCGILLPKDVWTHGQIYVAFSRCGNPNNIYVWAEQSQFETYNLSKQKTYVKNVVYNEVIKDITSE